MTSKKINPQKTSKGSHAKQLNLINEYFEYGWRHMVPCLDDLEKELSITNELRNKFWKKLRTIRNQIVRYIKHHNIEEEEFKELIGNLPDAERTIWKKERTAARNIPLARLNELLKTCNVIWDASGLSGFKEELIRKSNLKNKDVFFTGKVCELCGLPLSGGRKKKAKYCSRRCYFVAKSRHYRKEHPDKKAQQNLRYLKSIYPMND